MMLSTIAVLGACAAALTSAAPVAQNLPPATVDQPFSLVWFYRNSFVDTEPPVLPYSPVGALSLFEPTKGIPLAQLRLLGPSGETGGRFTLRGGYLHVSAVDVAVPGGDPSSPNYGWNSNNTIGFTEPGAIEFKNFNFGADGDMHMNLTTRAIDLDHDYSRFYLCYGGKWNDDKDQGYVSFGADAASTRECDPIFLYGRPIPSS